MKEKESNLEIRKIGVEHYNLIQFGGRSFFIPVQFHTTTYGFGQWKRIVNRLRGR